MTITRNREQLNLNENYQNAIERASRHFQTVLEFKDSNMRENVDYGVIPGCKQPSLLKPGAEKLCRLFGLRPTFELIHSVVDFNKPLFFYHYRCNLYRNDIFVASGDGSANSFESIYQEEPEFIFDSINKICKMAQKRAFVAVVLMSCGASEFFAQDIEDLKNITQKSKKS